MHHFIDLNLIDKEELKEILKLAQNLKSQSTGFSKDEQKKMLVGKHLLMIFEQKSTRTRTSFEVAINNLGGHAIVMNAADMQLGKGETVADTAKVLSRFGDAIMIRANDHKTITELAENASIPVINALSNFSHPCQIMASVLTIIEKLGNIEGKKLAWFGDANNVLNSYIHGSKLFNYQLNIALPKELDFCNEEIDKAKKQGANINYFEYPKEAAENADVLITDTWFSMGNKESEDDKAHERKLNLLKPYQVNQSLISLANPNAIFTHCLPAYRDFEVTAEVIDSDKSVVFDEAENRLHAQKAILLWTLNAIPRN